MVFVFDMAGGNLFNHRHANLGHQQLSGRWLNKCSPSEVEVVIGLQLAGGNLFNHRRTAAG